MSDASDDSKPAVPLHVQAAKASWLAPLIGIIVFTVVGRSATSREVTFAVACISGIIYSVGLVFAVWAIVEAFRKGPLRILFPASIGLAINGLIVYGFVATLFIAQDLKQRSQANEQQSNQDQSSQVDVENWGGLRTTVGGHAVADADLVVVMLHGYGAPGSDMVGLGQAINAPPKTAFLFPEGPVAVAQGGLAWYRPSGDRFEASRDQVRQLIAEISRQSPHCDIVVGGFSQGAILSSNLLTEANESQLKGVILYSPAFDLTHPPSKNQALPRVMIAHGRSDRILPFSESEKLKEQLEAIGCEVTFVAFEGSHTIPPAAVEATTKFLRDLQQGATAAAK